jgi:hypothetical protein
MVCSERPPRRQEAAVAERRPYIVRQGDHVARLAFQLGYAVDELWDHPANDPLRDGGRTADILHPGDVLYVPDRDPWARPLTLEADNPFSGRIPTVRVELVFKVDGAPRAGEAYEVEDAGSPIKGEASAEGLVSFEVPGTARRVKVVFQEPRAVYHVDVGHVDPVTERSGVFGRLRQLGYLRPDASPEDLSDDDRRGVLGAFQADHGLPPTDTLDDATRALLVRLFGC